MNALTSPRAFWNAALARTLQPVDPSQVWPYVFNTLRDCVLVTSLAVIEYSLDAMPKVLVNISEDDPVGNRISAYVKGAYLLDPFFRASLRGEVEGCYSIEDLSNQDSGEREYFESFFSVYGLGDEINIFHQLGGCVSLAVSLGREAGAPKFSESDYAVLQDCHPFLSQLAVQLHQGMAGESGSSDRLLQAHFHNGVKTAIERLGSSVLTAREKTVFDFLLRGYSVKSTADRLNIREGTVRMHRYNIYVKLDVSSQTELFALIMESLKTIQLPDNRDPLTLLTERTRSSQSGNRDQIRTPSRK